jgi:hypothetical protein
MNQVKLIIRFLLFTVFCGTLYTVLVLAWGHFLPTSFNKNNPNAYNFKKHNEIRMTEVKQLKDIDILFLGSSHAYKNFDPRIFAKKTIYDNNFNLGSSAQTPIQTQVLISRYLKKLNPKVVIYEMNPDELLADGTESSIDILKTDYLDLSITKLAIKQLNLKVFNSLVFAAIPSEKNSSIADFNSSNAKYIKGGYLETSNVFYKNKRKFKKGAPDFKSFQLEALIQNVSTIKESGTKLYIVQAPVTKRKYNSFLKNAKFDSLLKDLGHYHNYNLDLPLNDTLHFYDSHHLNNYGVKIFNDRVISDLIN